MALKDRIRSAVSRKSSNTTSTSSPSSSQAPSPTSSGFTTPITLSRTPSSTALPDLLPSATTNTLKLSKTTSTSSSSSSRFSLSRYRSSSSSKSKERQYLKYAPKNYKFAQADPARIAVIEAWEWGLTAEVRDGMRGSVCSGVSPYASRRNSLAA